VYIYLLFKFNSWLTLCKRCFSKSSKSFKYENFFKRTVFSDLISLQAYLMLILRIIPDFLWCMVTMEENEEEGYRTGHPFE